MRLLSQRWMCVLNFLDAAKVFQTSIILYSHQWRMWVLVSPYPCRHLVLSVCNFSHSGGSGVSRWFYFAFLWWIVMESDFSCAYWPFVYLLWSIRSFAPFLLDCLSFYYSFLGFLKICSSYESFMMFVYVYTYIAREAEEKWGVNIFSCLVCLFVS